MPGSSTCSPGIIYTFLYALFEIGSVKDASVEEVNDAFLDLVLEVCIVVDLMAVSGVENCLYIASRFCQPVGDLIDAFTVLSYRILITCDIVYRQL